MTPDTSRILADAQRVLELSEKATAGPWTAIDTFGPALCDIAAPDRPGEGSPNIIAAVLWGDGLTAAEAESVAGFIARARTFAPEAARHIIASAGREAKLREALKAATDCMQQVEAIFDGYAKLHTLKNTPEGSTKAADNASRAAVIRDALQRIDALLAGTETTT